MAPELRSPFLWLPVHVDNRVVLAAVRRALAKASRPHPEVEVETWSVSPSADDGGGATVPAYLYRATTSPQGALLWIHGGGTVAGHPRNDHELCSRLAVEANIVVVSVDYRLAPEHPYPAGLEDCHTVLRHLYRSAADLGFPEGRVAIGGASAGGGLAATLAQLTLDTSQVPVVLQLLLYPMLDDRTVLRRDHGGRGRVSWSPRSNRYAWSAYLDVAVSEATPHRYASAARRDDLTGLPSAWIGIGDLDLFHDESITYASRLSDAGVRCDLHVVPRMPHGADVWAGRAESMQSLRRRMSAALVDAMSCPVPPTPSAGRPRT